jgi:hypothetical protein
MGLQSNVLEMIVECHNERKLISDLGIQDEESGLYPFMSVASQSNYGLDTVYMLAMKHPHLL